MTTQLLFTARGYTAQSAGKAPIGHARSNEPSGLLGALCGATIGQPPPEFADRLFDPQHPKACPKCARQDIEATQIAAGVRYRIRDSKFGRLIGSIHTTRAEAIDVRRFLGSSRRYDIEPFTLGTGGAAELPAGERK